MACLGKIELLGDNYLVEFINDTISFYLKNMRVPFLSKYGHVVDGVHNVVPVRECVIEIIKLALRKSYAASTLDVYKASIVGYFETLGFEMAGE